MEDPQSQPEVGTETTAAEVSATNDDVTTTAVDQPVDTSEGAEPQAAGEDDIQPAPKDDEAKATEEPEITEETKEPEIVEDAGTGGVAEVEGEVEEEATPTLKSSNPKSAMVLLYLLEGEEKQLEKKKKVKADELVTVAHDDSGVVEKDFFSLFYYDDCERSSGGHTLKLQQKIFVDPTKQVKSQLYPSAKQQQPWKLNYGVKFFIPDPAKLKEEHSKYLYCLQLCDDIRNNLVRVDRETAIRLTALMLQGRIGDYDEENHQTGYINKYPRMMLLPRSMQPSNYEAQVVTVHKAKAGYSPAQADEEFLQIAKELPRYGQHQFLANDTEGHVVTIGNGCRGISVYYHKDDGMPDQHIEWRNIVKISYKRRRFKIRFQPKQNDNEPASSGQRSELLKFVTGDAPQAKRIWRNAVEQHTFFRLTEPEPPSVFNAIFRRGTSFRYSGRTYRQTLRDKKRSQAQQDTAPKHTPVEKTFEIRPNQSSVNGNWELEVAPPRGEGIDLEKFEHQKVVVDFRLSEGLPDDTRHYVIQRDKSGSYEVLSTGLIEDDKKNERSYYLSEIDENSKAATVSVSLNIEPPSGVDVTLNDQNDRGERKGVTIFDSERMPVVKLGSASMVTTSTVIESEGRKLTTGEHSQRYPLEEVADVNMVNGEVEQWARPAVDGSDEAKQVDMFLESEHAAFQKAFEEDISGGGDATNAPPHVEILTEN